MSDLISSLFLVLGALVILLAAVGIVKLPDLYMRLSASAKASTMGITLMLFGAAFYFYTIEIFTKVTVIALFLMITSPVAAGLIARLGYKTGTKLWYKTLRNDLEEKDKS